MKSLIAFYFCFLISHAYCDSLADLKEMDSETVLEVKRIYVPNYPFAFNPSIVRWKGVLLMSFRDIEEPYYSIDFDSAGYSKIGLTFIDEAFKPIGEPQILDLQGDLPTPSRAEDPRLINVGDRLYLIYSDNQEEIVTKGGYRMHVAELEFADGRFIVKSVDKLTQFEGQDEGRREKNWVPFEYNQELLLAYSITPHLVMHPLLGANSCETISKTSGDISWKWGELRGGTPGVLIDGNNYLAFFHSSKNVTTDYSKGEHISHYFMGAYVYSAQPPFGIKRISPSPIIVKQFYADNVYIPYWKPLNVVFPGGIIQDTKHVWVVYGRHDHEMWVIKFDLAGLLQTLVSVSE